MRLQVDAPDTSRFAIQMEDEQAGFRLAATMKREDRGWELHYEIDGKSGSMSVGPSRMPWPTALGRALRDLLTHLGH
jgi:hypothetical protein